MIEVKDLYKTLGNRMVLSGITLRIEASKTLVILGRSGCGKSVLLKHLVGLLQPDSGQVLVDGEDIAPLGERSLGAIRKKIGILFQSGALFDSMSVGENIAFPLRESGLLDPKILQQKVAEALEMVDLAGEENKMPENLSGGMRKRVGLARTIVSRPACILYDEPTTGLDPIASDSINHLIRRLQRRLEATSVVVTHDMKTAFHTADEIAFLHEGKIYFQGCPRLFKDSQDPVIRNFIEGISGDSD
jgi:phospholipid/cholesterol/gamma-HCH transport system ATP-binding protein